MEHQTSAASVIRQRPAPTFAQWDASAWCHAATMTLCHRCRRASLTPRAAATHDGFEILGKARTTLQCLDADDHECIFDKTAQTLYPILNG